MTAAAMPDREDEQVFRVTQPDGGEKEVAVAARLQYQLLQNHGVRGVSYRSHRAKGAVEDRHVITLEEAPLHLAKKAGLPMEAAKARIRYECQTRRMLMFNRPEGSYHPELIGTHRIDFGRLPLGSSGLLLLIDEVDGLAQLVKEELPSKGKNRISDSDQLLAVMVEAGIWLEHHKGAEKVKYLEYFIGRRLKEMGAARGDKSDERYATLAMKAYKSRLKWLERLK